MFIKPEFKMTFGLIIRVGIALPPLAQPSPPPPTPTHTETHKHLYASLERNIFGNKPLNLKGFLTLIAYM